MNRSRLTLICTILLIPAVTGLWLAVGRTSRGAPEQIASAAQQDDYVQTIIEPTDPQAVAFGEVIDMSGDLMVAGAPYTDGSSNQSGAVYILRQDANAPNGWAPVATLRQPIQRDYSYFGQALAMDGDTALVGAPSDPRPQDFIQGGAAYLYERNEGGPDAWGFVAELSDELQENWRWFGRSVALDGDLAAVSVMGADNSVGTEDAGKVLIYSRDAGWTQIAFVDDPFGAEDDSFGWSLDLEGDTLVVGATIYTAGQTAPNPGAVYIFRQDEGGPNAWGLVKKLQADVPLPSADFGYSLDLDGDTLAVGAAHETLSGPGLPTVVEAGAVYIFERNEGGPDTWGQVAHLQPEDATETQRFGASVVLNGEDLWVGIPDADHGSSNDRGSVVRYGRNHGGPDAWGLVTTIEPDGAVSYDHFGTSLATLDDRLLASAPHLDGHGVIYDISVPDVDPTLFTVMFPVTAHDWTPPTGTLEDGGSFESASGAIIGALPGTLSGPLMADIFPVALPADLPGSFVVRGDAYRMLSDQPTIAPAETPFLVGLPVPAGADVTKLGVALNMSNRFATENGEPPYLDRSWTTAPGSYDPATNLFVFTLSTLLPEGVSAVLYEHPNNVPLPAAPVATSRTTQAVAYQVVCDPAAVNSDVCSVPTLVSLVQDEFEQAHTTFVDSHGFRPPALIHGVGIFVGNNKVPQLYETNYRAMIASTPCTSATGEPILGQYSYASYSVLVCIDQSAPSEQITETVRHELFHAIQASYPAVASDHADPAALARSHWTLEGTASAAEKSSFIMVRNPDWTLRMATEPMTSTVNNVEYDAQDFWVFTGLEGTQIDHSIGYLKAVFNQGATPEHVSVGIDLDDAYWEWAKNQVYEHFQPMLAAFDRGPCELELDAVGLNNINVMEYPSEQIVDGPLPPLTTAVVLIRMGVSRPVLYVDAATTGAEDEFNFKVYETEGLAGCKDLPDGARALQDLAAESSRWVLVSNLSVSEDITYTVFVE